uniref:Uncharacterized protein n=1 Tax=Anguilla anguilla TaxID=7936 RepID=A0A0E9PTY9_ANGAN
MCMLLLSFMGISPSFDELTVKKRKNMNAKYV